MEQKRTISTLFQVLGWFILTPAITILIAVVIGAVFMVSAISQGYGIDTVSTAMLGLVQEGSNAMSLGINGIVLLIILIAGRRSQQGLGSFTGLSAQVGGLWMVFMCVVSGIAANVWFSLVLNSGIVPDAMLDAYMEYASVLEGGHPVLRLIAIALMAPIVEELLNRGIILGKLTSIMPAWAAVLIQALLFGLAHGQMLWIIYATAGGVIIGYIRMRGGGVRAAIIFHMVFNATSEVRSYLESPFYENPVVYNIAMVASGALLLAAIIALTRRRDGVVS